MIAIRRSSFAARALAAATLALGACQPSPAPTTTSPVQSTMYRHFAVARDMRSLAVTGDLEQLRTDAEALTVTEETWGLPPGSGDYLARMRSAASGVAKATDLEGAAVAVAQVARTCGECHLAKDADLGQRFQVAQPLVNDPATRHVNYLSWASRLLWNGLLGPSDRLWGIGAGALADLESIPEPSAPVVPAEEAERARHRLAELGAEAVTQDDPVSRATTLGRIWAVCGGCHSQAGVGR